MEYDKEQFEYFVNGYVQALLFACVDSDNNPLDENFSGSDINYTCFDAIEADCRKFLELAVDHVESGDLEQIGMDFYYVRNGHGVGFKDRDIPMKDKLALTEVAKSFSEHGQIFVIDDEIYIE